MIRQLLLCALLVGCAGTPEESEGPWRVRWIKSAGDGATQFGYGVALDGDQIYVVGEYGGAIDFGAGSPAASRGVSGYVTRLDRDGRARWTRRIGGSGDASAYVVAARGGHVWVGGYFKGDLEGRPAAGESDAYLLELDEQGTTIALRTYGDAGSQAITALAIDDDAIAFAGDFDGTIDLGAGPLTTAGQTDVFFAVLGRDFTPRLAKRFGGSNLDRRPRLAMDKESIYLAATYRGPIDVGGPLPDVFDGAFLARFGRDGTHRWTKGMPGDGWCFPTSLAVDARGAVAMGARFTRMIDVGAPLTSASGEDGLLAIFERDGALRFAERFGGFGQDAISSVAFAGEDVLIAGELQAALGPITSSGAADAFVARLHEGKMTWFERLGDAEEQRATRVAVDPKGAVVVGSFFGSITTGGSRVLSNGGFDLSGGDVFVAALGP